MRLPLPSKAATIVAMATASLCVPATAQTTSPEPPEDFDGIFCWNFYPGATYEELLILCAEDVPPYGGGGGGGPDFPNGPLWPAGDCDRASRLCDYETP